MKRVDWSEWDGKLGATADAQVATLIGCSASAVGSRRRKLGIPSSAAAKRRPRWAKHQRKVARMKVRWRRTYRRMSGQIDLLVQQVRLLEADLEVAQGKAPTLFLTQEEGKVLTILKLHDSRHLATPWDDGDDGLCFYMMAMFHLGIEVEDMRGGGEA